MDFLLAKATKLINTGKNNGDIQFHIYDERTEYYTILPDEILEIILNELRSIKVCFVSYQFYIVNRPFVAKCYHLHHYIPTIQDALNRHALHAIHFIDYNNVKLYKFRNINVDIPDNLLNLTDNTNIIDIIYAFIMDEYIQIAINTIEDNVVAGGDYELLTKINGYAIIFNIILKHKDFIMKILEQQLLTTHLYTVYEQIMDLFDEEERNIILKSMTNAIHITHMSIEQVINMFDNDKKEAIYKMIFTKEDVIVLDKIYTYEFRKNAYDILRKGTNFNIDITHTIFLSRQFIKKDTHL